MVLFKDIIEGSLNMQKQDVIDIAKDAGYGFLATVEGDQPRVRPVAPYLTDDGEILISLVPQSRAIGQIKENSKIELCFVDRQMRFCRIQGAAQLSVDVSKKEIIFNNMPMLRQFFDSPEDPNFNLVVVNPAYVEAMSPHLQDPIVIAF